MLKIYKFTLPEITCSACIEPVRNTLRNQRWQLNDEGSKQVNVKDLKINTLRKSFEIEIESEGLTEAAVRNFIIEKLAEVGTVAGQEPPHLLKGGIGVVGGLGFLLISFLGLAIPMPLLVGASTLLSFYVGKEIFQEAYRKTTRLHTLEMNALFSTSALIAIAVSITSIFVPWLPCMLEAALLTFGFRHLGIAIENRAKDKVIDSVSFKELAPPQVFVKTAEAQFELRNIEDINPGDVIRVGPDQVVPLDGTCLSQDARLDVSIVTGSTTSKAVALAAKITAGMKVKSSQPVDIQVTKAVHESYLARMDNAILKAETQKAPLEATSQQILKYFIPALFLLSMATAGIAGWMFGTAMAIKCAVSLLVSACPCTLGSIVPLAVTVGLAKASKQDILFRSGDALQAAGKTDTVIFDLNGTLTEGNYQVVNAQFLGKIPAIGMEKLFNFIYELEKDASHPIGIAIKEHLAKQHYVGLHKPCHVESVNGGRKLCYNNENYYVGNRTLLQTLGINLSEYNIPTAKAHEQMIFIIRDQTVLGYITLQDPLKPSGAATVKELRKMGMDVHICTGADRATALSYAELLKISPEKVHADCIPLTDPANPASNTKVAYIKTLQENHHIVAMVGDALNDAPALETSDLGVFVKSHVSDDMMEGNAAVVVQHTSLSALLPGFQIGYAMVQNIQQNLALSFIYNFATLGLISCFACCMGIAINPAIGVLLMIGQASVVLTNVYRFKLQKTDYATRVATNENSHATIYQKLGIEPELNLNSTQKVAPTQTHTTNILNLQSYQQQAKVTPTAELPKFQRK